MYIENKLFKVDVSEVIQKNRKNYKLRKQREENWDVAVFGWDLGHNAAGRVYNLAEFYSKRANVKIVGNLYLPISSELWPPLKNIKIETILMKVNNWENYIEKIVEFVFENPFQIVHLSKPRAPNVIVGFLYKVIWNSKVIVDIDDEELAFNKSEKELEKRQINLLHEKEWTKIAIECIDDFDMKTVVSNPLIKKYGGLYLPHMRNEEIFHNNSKRKIINRLRLSILQSEKVIIFLGTPRKHKGLVNVAKAISKLDRKDVTFLIIGKFDDVTLENQLKSIERIKYKFINQIYIDQVPDYLAVADLCILLQDQNDPICKYQFPAKIVDAMSMCIPVVTSNVEALEPLCMANAIIGIDESRIFNIVKELIDNDKKLIETGKAGRKYFMDNLSYKINSNKLDILFNLENKSWIISDKMIKFISELGSPICNELLNISPQ